MSGCVGLCFVWLCACASVWLWDNWGLMCAADELMASIRRKF